MRSFEGGTFTRGGEKTGVKKKNALEREGGK